MAKILNKVVYYYCHTLGTRYILTPLFLASVISGIMCALSPIAKADPPKNSCNWQLTLSDDFNTIDRSKWSTLWPQYYNGKVNLDGRVRRQAYYPDSNVQTVYDPDANSNVLAIRTAREDTLVDWLNNKRYNYTSGILTSETKFSQQYGYFEVRAKLPSTFGSAPSFWLMDFSKDQVQEIDVVEVSGREKGLEVVQNVHWGKNEENWNYHKLSDGDSGSKYRNYGVLWEPNQIVWYIDGEEVFRSPKGSPTNSLSLVLSNEVEGGPGNTFYEDPAKGKLPLLSWFDSVKVWSCK